jgi:hypothetical protein
MYPIKHFILANATPQLQQSRLHEHESYTFGVAQTLYQESLRDGLLARFGAALTGRPRCLLDLHLVEKTCAIQGRFYAGTHTVPIRRIRGSLDRCADFDAAFHPIRTHNRARWLGIAVARQKGVPLPPVRLVQVGDLYFVEDGHHRISVARAMGQEEIDAEVIVWQTGSPLPWQVTEPSRQGFALRPQADTWI